jgi:hypothetical protein
MTEEVTQETVVEPVVTTEETTPPPEETAKTGDEEVQPEAKPERTFTQKELDDILTRRLAKESRKVERYARAEAERDQLREQLNRQTQAQQASIPSGEPKPEQFKTYEDYLDKLTDWKLDQRLAKVNEQSQNQQRIESQGQLEARIRENLNKAADKYDDFEDVVTNPALPVTEVMRDALGDSEMGGELAYYLGTHLKEAADIAKLSNVQQVKAIDRLEAKLKAPVQVSKAPAPAEVVGKGRAASTVDPEKMSIDEYAAWRSKNARWGRK